MAISRSFRVVLWSLGGAVVVAVLWIGYSNLRYWRALRDSESSKAAGLAASPPPAEVAFDLVSPWRQSFLSKMFSSGGTVPIPLTSATDSFRVAREPANTESYDTLSDNPFVEVRVDPRSTFSADVDTASYANMRRFITDGKLPPKDAVRIEEMLNYFTYDYEPPNGDHPIHLFAEVASAPWAPKHRLVRIGVKSREIDFSKRAAANLVFLIDVSGSMDEPSKLPLLKNAMKLLVDNITPSDHVAIVVYAGAEGIALQSTTGDKKTAILEAIDSLSPRGSTNGAAGIQRAYSLAASTFIKGGINRVILATDGDFNVGVTSEGDLVRLIQDKAKTGVFLSVLGFGEGNLKDSTLEKLADHGNGNYSYIDSMNEARKVLVQEIGGTLATVAKDVKIQVEFNPAEVRARRLIGYENRILEHQDFNNDAKDAGDMGAGHAVTALFELIPAKEKFSGPSVDPLRYQNAAELSAASSGGELLSAKVRYKEPESDVSKLLELVVVDSARRFVEATEDFRFAGAVAAFGMVLRESPHKGNATLDEVVAIADQSRGPDRNGYRAEFVQLARKAQTLKR